MGNNLEQTILLHFLKCINDWQEKAIKLFAVLISGIIVSALVVSALTRYLSGTGYDWFIELPPALIPWIVFPLLGPLFRSGAHIKVDLFMNFLTKTQLLLLELLVCVIVLVGAGMFFVAGTEAVELFRRLGQLMELEIEIPIWWMYLAFPVGFAILISFVLEMILEKSTELYQLSKSSK